MRGFKKIIIFSVFFILYSCFNHTDEVTIYKSGKIELVSTIEITDKETGKADVKEEIKDRINALKKEGWKVSHKWTKKSKPYKIRFKASNNLTTLYNYQKQTKGNTPSGVYITKKFSEKQYVISFDLLKDANNRVINLNNKSISLFRLGDNDDLIESRRIKSEKNYYVFLK